MNGRWYVQLPGQSSTQEYSTESLGEAVNAGHVPGDALAYSVDNPSWRPVRDVLASSRQGPTTVEPTISPPPVTVVAEQSTKHDGKGRSAPPTMPPQAPSRARLVRRSLLVGSTVLVAAALLIFLMMSRGTTARDAGVSKAVVQIDAGRSGGTGFFVEGPDEWAYVATAFHVIDCGCPVSVARAIEVSDDRYYVEAYPDTEVVAYDADADLAILRLRNVKADRFQTLKLAQKPEKGEPIKAYGFPGRTLMRRQGLLKQQGDILSIGKFPVVDTITGQVLRDNAVDGLLISASIEHGYSGGPTCNERGEVVGITTVKDRTKTQHNGAVSVDSLAKLLAQVRPAQKQQIPTDDEVKALLKRIEMQYLLQPVEKRVSTRPHEFIALADRPHIQAIASLIRQMEAPAEQAELGLFMATQAGHPLQTYFRAQVHQAISDCEKRATGLKGLLQQLAPGTQASDADAVVGIAMAECEAVTERPIVWDFTAMTLQWDNKERELSVSKVEVVDDDQPVFRASVASKGASTSFDVWLRREGDQLKLKLFDDKGRPYGLNATRTVSPSALTGTWVHLSPQAPHPAAPKVSIRTEETLQVSAQSDGTVQVRHTVRADLYAPAGDRFTSCWLQRAGGMFEQSLIGKIDGGAARVSYKGHTYSASELASCKIDFPYAPDKEVVMKIRDDKLVMYRTDGHHYPEEVEFERK